MINKPVYNTGGNIMAVLSRQKGNGYERKISNLLSKRFESITGITNSFRRNIDSGSFFGGSNQSRTKTHDLGSATFGDINCPANFTYSLECKHYKDAPSFSLIMSQNVKEWDLWVKQAEQDSKNSNKKMVIIVKYNRVADFVILSAPVSGVYNLPYKQNFIVSLTDFLALPDTEFFV